MGMGLVYQVKDYATSGLAKISAGITTVTKAAQKAAAQTPSYLASIGKSTGRTFTGGANAMQAFGAQVGYIGARVKGMAFQAESGFQRMAAAIRAPIDRLQSLKAVLAGVASAWGGMKIINAAAYEEQARMALGVMLKNDDAGNLVFEKARAFGDVTPFDTQQVIAATRLAVSSKFRLNEIFQDGLLTDMGNLAAANSDMGIDIREVSRVFARLKAGDFGEAFERLRDMQIGFQDLQEAGLNVRAGGTFTGLDPDRVVAAVRGIVQKRFGGMMDKMQHSWQGVWSTFTSNITNSLAAVGATKIPGGDVTVLDAVKERVIGLTAALVDDQGKLTPATQRIIQLAARGFGLVGTVFDRTAKGIKTVAELVRTLVAAFGPLPDVAGGLSVIGQLIGRMTGRLNNHALWYRAGMFLRDAFAAALPVLGQVWDIILIVHGWVEAITVALWRFAGPILYLGGLALWTILGVAVGSLADLVGWLNSGTVAADFTRAALAGVGAAIIAYNVYQKAIVLWSTLAAAATGAFSAALGFLNTVFIATPIGWIVLAVGALVGIVYLAVKYWDKWTAALVRFGQWIWDGLMGALHAVTGWFSDLPGWIRWAVVAFMPFIGVPLIIAKHWDAIRQVFMDLPAQALQWGSNFIRMFGDGIAAGVQYVRDKVIGVSRAIKDFLGFSSPTRLGPGHTAHRWAPNFMAMYAEGIEDGTPSLAVAARGAASTLAALTPRVTPAGVIGPSGAETPRRQAQDAPQGQSSVQPITVIARLVLPDGRELAETIIPVLREEAALGFGR